MGDEGRWRKTSRGTRTVASLRSELAQANARELGLTQALETGRARSYAIDSRAREVLRTGEETERELAEARRDHASIIAATKAVGIGWRENEDGAETCHNVRAEQAERERDAERTRYVLADAGWREMNRQVVALEADLAAMRALLKDPACLTCAREGEHCGRCWCCRAIQTAEAMPEGWLATAPEMAEELEHLVDMICNVDNRERLLVAAERARALLARPEVKAWAGR